MARWSSLNISCCICSTWLANIFIGSISRNDLSSCVASLCRTSNIACCTSYISLLSSCSIRNWNRRRSDIGISRNSASSNISILTCSISCWYSSYILGSCNIWSWLSTNNISCSRMIFSSCIGSCFDITCINCLLSFNLEWLIRIMNNLSK